MISAVSPLGIILLSLTVVVVILALAVYLNFSFIPFQVLKRNGIKGPTPSFFYGNFKEIEKVGFAKFMEELCRKYGPVVGFYLGKNPVILVMDIELLKHITVKDFDLFTNRPLLPNMFRQKPGLLRSRDEAWRVARHTLSPTFSSSKIKAMTPLIENSVKVLVEIFKEHADSDKSLEFFRTYGSFTMESIFATAFGRVMDVQRDKTDRLTKAASTFFSMSQEGKKNAVSPLHGLMLMSTLPWLVPVLQYLSKGSPAQKAFSTLYETAIALIKQRRTETETGKYKDLLQLMIDATVEEGDEDGQNQNTINKKRLSDEEITSHSITFMLAGYETTANALSYTSYLLALNPHIQEKLQEEIDSYFEENPETSLYQTAQDLDYLDMVLQESLRLYPPAPVFGRECAKAYTYKGMTIPKGASVFIASSLLHKDPKYWQDPEKFDPLRFTPEEKAKRPQQCYMPFGAGPRSCIGMRFALLEAKIALIELLNRFTFLRAPDTEVPLETILGITMAPKNGIYLKVVTRK